MVKYNNVNGLTQDQLIELVNEIQNTIQTQDRFSSSSDVVESITDTLHRFNLDVNPPADEEFG